MKKAAVFILIPIVLVSTYFLWSSDSDPGQPRSMASKIAPNYESFEACEKQRILWDRIQTSTHKELPRYRELGLAQVMAMGMQSLSTKATLQSDFAPEGWKKYLHRRGAIAKIKIVPTGGTYTGIFLGAECALLRLSLTYQPNKDRAVAPGLALKVLRDGVSSANISALVSLDGQEKDYGFFKNPMSNIVPLGHSMGQKIVHKLFKRVSDYPEELLATDMALIDSRGEKSRNTVSPRQLFFVPGPGLSFSSAEHDVREDFARIPAGTTIYRLHALSAKHTAFDYSKYTSEMAQAFLRESEHIADLVTTSEFLASEFGDDGIFFKHETR